MLKPRRHHHFLRNCSKVFQRSDHHRHHRGKLPLPYPIQSRNIGIGSICSRLVDEGKSELQPSLKVLLPSSHLSTTVSSNLITEVAVSLASNSRSDDGGDTVKGNAISSGTSTNAGKAKRHHQHHETEQQESIDSFGTWDTTTDLPLAVTQSIASGKPIPSICASSIGVSSMKGRRAYNEDTYSFQSLDESLLYFAVFDGHGGAACAKFCALNFPKVLNYWIHRETEITNALHNSFLEMNNAFIRWITQKNNDELNAGSTATVCLLHDSVSLYIGHVGDSRAIICRSGEPRKLTQDHVPSLITEKERIEKSGGRCSQTRVNDRLAMSRSIGDLDLKSFGVIADPDVRMMKVDHSRDAFLVLTTDGINHVMTDKEIVEAVKETTEPQHAAALLTETAFHYSSEDNITAMVIPLGSWGKYSAAATIFHSFGKSMKSSSRFS